MALTLPTAKSPAVRSNVEGLLRQAFLEGAFRPGESLSDVKLAAMMQVSRLPIREALLILEQEGLVVHSQNRGFAVINLDRKDFLEICDVRLSLESRALELAKSNIAPDSLRRLEELSREITGAFANGQPRKTAALDLAFHTLIWESAGNSWLLRALNRSVRPSFMFAVAYELHGAQLDPATLSEQHELYVNYVKGTVDQSARACVENHLRLFFSEGAGASGG